MILYIIKSILLALVGVQVSIQDFKLLKYKYNYRIGIVQITTLLSLLLGVLCFLHDIFTNNILVLFVIMSLSLPYTIIAFWAQAKINSKSFIANFVYLCIAIVSFQLTAYTLEIQTLSFAFTFGLLYRNNKLGNSPFLKQFLLFSRLKYIVKNELSVKELEYEGIDFSYAGCKQDIDNTTIYNVNDYGIISGTDNDWLDKLQSLIEEVGKKGGGTIFFPKGQYFFNKTNNAEFIQINYSNITLSGEVSSEGKPLAILVNCNKTLCGDKNPWLSPFFITTGEEIQKSNIFWGLQFKKKRNIITKSGSMSDPGSDGTILTPEYLTAVTETVLKGSTIIKVKDSNCLKGYKFILIGMYNTTEDGNLIKDILGVDELRPEWGTPLRAGVEKAPSYQWLVEISNIIDEHTIELCRPLLRDINTIYDPEIYGVDMLENVCIRDLVISSKWNGLFRHHGFPRYYSIKQAQEMDYGWNAINMKRVAHGMIQNIVFDNYTNPLYVMDSRNITVENCIFQGPDGHQGIKLYEHTCDCLFKDIIFYNNYADMMGGEGNAYGNVFDTVTYCNPYFNPVDFDFHGFSEGPMSPPSHNLFINIHGFRNIKGAGAEYNQPACAQYNIWVNWERVGNIIGEPIFENIHYMYGKHAVDRNIHEEFFKNSTIKGIKEVEE